MNKLNRRTVLKIAGGVTAALATPAVLRAQEAYPSRPINMVVPFDTGGYNDRLARAFAPFLQETIGQPIVIVNRGGAGAMLGHTYFMQQPDDGYTVLCTSAAPYIPLNILTQNAQFKIDDFSMINLPSRDYTLMATSADSGIENVEQVIEQLRADAGALSIGIQPASADLVNMMLFADANGIDRTGLRLVTFDGGGPTRNAAAGGVVDIGMVGGQGFIPLAEKIRPLVVFDDAPRDGWDAPVVTDVSGSDAQFVSGSQRGWAVHSTFIAKHPDRYAILLNAIEETTKDPKVIESLKGQKLATDWFGPDVSNKALVNTGKVMEQHVDLLKGT
ncbi:MAG: tripartite tricarboxylate transporter substrate-binding protein [Hyphomicrobiales bacterium]